MESTGVYWRSVSPVLEGSFQIVVGNAHHIKRGAWAEDLANMLLSTRGGGSSAMILARDHTVDARDLPQQRKLSVRGQKRLAQAGDASMSVSIAPMRLSGLAIQKARRLGDKGETRGRFASPSSPFIPTFCGFDVAGEYDRWARGGAPCDAPPPIDQSPSR
jgi:hypothetical protein